MKKYYSLFLMLLLAALPISEARLALATVPLVYSDSQIALPYLYLLIFFMNCLPIYFVYYFSAYILRKMLKIPNFYISTFAFYVLQKGEKLGSRLKKSKYQSVYFALFIFVALPLPGSGIWTAALAASILNLDFKKTFIACACGIIAAMFILTVTIMGILIF